MCGLLYIFLQGLYLYTSSKTTNLRDLKKLRNDINRTKAMESNNTGDNSDDWQRINIIIFQRSKFGDTITYTVKTSIGSK